jgi:mono/diheme cytochrome c family protein
MPPQASLSDQKIADVLTYVRNSFGNKASAVTAPEVKKVRSTVTTVADKTNKKIYTT